MSNGRKEPVDTQRTKKGAEIPVPKLGDVLRDLKKVAKGRRSTSDSAKK